MRRVRLFELVVAIGLTASPASHAQDFDPRGRRHTAPPPHPAPPRPADARSPSAAPAASAGASQTLLIERYTQVVLAQPGAPFPLQRLAQLYRERDGNLTRLVSDFEARASQAGADQYPATVALAGLYKVDGRTDDAIAAYQKAIAQKSGDATAVMALARVHHDRGDLASARPLYEQALAHQTAQADKEQTLRTLMGIALDQKDWDGASRFHADLVKLQPTSLFVKGELGRELYNRSEFSRAEVELKEVVTAATGDNRALAPALKELGLAQAKAHESREALATLKRALSAAGPQSALRGEIYAIITEIYRADQQLPALVKELEDEHPNDYSRLAILAALYEETGDGDRAIETYKRALALNPREVDLRLRMIHLLQANGDLDRAIVQYEGLIRAAPNNPQFVFEECDALLQRGDHAHALKLVTDLETRAAVDEEVLSRVADFYARIGESERSLKVLQRLTQTSGADPGHLVDLGDRYFQAGNVPLAVQTWKRILVVMQPRAKALVALGDVYLEHDRTSDALAAYKEAVDLEPANLGYKKALAAAYERGHSYREAQALYEETARKAKEKGDKPLLRECRTRIVTLWGLERVLEQQVQPLRQHFGASPPDTEAGMTLAEVLLHMRRLPEAEATLRRAIEIAPGNGEAYGALERVLVQESKIADAIAVLEKLAQLEPTRARELYQRMAQYALQIYKDDDAIRFAARAVELNPDDAEGHRRLGEMYRSRQDVDHAIAEFRAAITKNDRLFVVYFELADLLLSKGQAEEADRLFRRVLRGAPDEELVARAARLSMQINLGKGTLESLEQDLLPLAIGNPQRPIYRRLLVEIYGSLTFGLVQRVHHGTPQEADDAKALLARIGARAVKPLLDALVDPDAGQQRIAIDVLAYVQNRNAALPLFAYATGPAEPALRSRAMVACGALADATMVPKYQALLYPKDALGDAGGLADTVAVAAVWGLARMRDAKAVPVLRRVARSGTPPMRAIAVLGLGMARDKASVSAVAEIARSVDSGKVARAAAAYALGAMDAQAQVPTLLEIAEDGDALPRQMALVALARMAISSAKEPAWQKDAVQAMADSVFAGEEEGGRGRAIAGALQRTAVAALSMIATRPSDARGRPLPGETMPVPEGSLDVDALLDALVPANVTEEARWATLLSFAEPLQRAAVSALRTSGPHATAVLDALATGGGEFLPFVARGASGAAADKARSIAASLESGIVALARHPDPAIRMKALVLVARSGAEGAAEATADGLEDPSEAVQRVALASVGVPHSGADRGAATLRMIAAAGKVLSSQDSWAMRVLAAGALGRLGGAGRTASAEAARRLIDAASTDAYALVRQAALDALTSFDSCSARVLADRLVAGDPEPRVRAAAEAIAGSIRTRGACIPRPE
jgi:tetratricopeptide (TPR) repeat protein/HEAT repeat protein